MDAFTYAKEQLESRLNTNRAFLEAGVILEDPATCYIDPSVTISAGARILPNTTLSGNTVIGAGCVIGPNTIIRDSQIGAGTKIVCSYLDTAVVEQEASIGPFAYLRPNTYLQKGVKIGDFVEIKNTTIGEGTKVAHLTYIGDADVGAHCNFGCGTVVVNYNGSQKFRSKIGDHAFIGCNTNLVSPVEVGSYGYTAAGSTITCDVPEGALAIARAKQENKAGWVQRKGYLKK